MLIGKEQVKQILQEEFDYEYLFSEKLCDLEAKCPEEDEVIEEYEHVEAELTEYRTNTTFDGKIIIRGCIAVEIHVSFGGYEVDDWREQSGGWIIDTTETECFDVDFIIIMDKADNVLAAYVIED